jgi:hypothetical protein
VVCVMPQDETVYSVLLKYVLICFHCVIDLIIDFIYKHAVKEN